jgi:hypothetical protein
MRTTHRSRAWDVMLAAAKPPVQWARRRRADGVEEDAHRCISGTRSTEPS